MEIVRVDFGEYDNNGLVRDWKKWKCDGLPLQIYLKEMTGDVIYITQYFILVMSFLSDR